MRTRLKNVFVITHFVDLRLQTRPGLCCLIIGNGGSCATAAPAARKVFDYWLLDRISKAADFEYIAKINHAFSNQSMLTATETGHIESFKPKRFAHRYGVDPLLTVFILITAFGLIILYSRQGKVCRW